MINGISNIGILIIGLLILSGCIHTTKQEEQKTENEEQWFFWSVNWHPHEDQFVAGGSNDSFLGFFSTETHQLIEKIPYKGTITNTQWHPSGKKIAITVQDQKSDPVILDVTNEESIILDSISEEGARAAGWSNTGELLAIGDYEGYIILFDQKGSFLKRVNTEQKTVIALDWHPEEDVIVAVSEHITIYVLKKDSVWHIDDREAEVLMLSVAWHPEGEIFVTGDYGIVESKHGPLLQYWNREGKRIKRIERSKAEFRNMEWTKNGETLATASDMIRLWDTKGNLLEEQGGEDVFWGVDWNIDGSALVTTDVGGRIIIYDRGLNKLKELQL